MTKPTELSIRMVSDVFFRHMKELSVRSLKELKEGKKDTELRLTKPSATLAYVPPLEF